MPWPRRKKQLSAAEVGKVQGFRSGLEEKVQAQLTGEGVAAEYEQLTIRYTPPAEEKRYTPDFVLPNAIIVETKGRFLSDDRKKHRLVKAEHPDLDIRFVFQNPHQTIAKKSKTTYAKWCEDHGFLWATKLIPPAWLKEPVNKKSKAAIEQLKERHNASAGQRGRKAGTARKRVPESDQD